MKTCDECKGKGFVWSEKQEVLSPMDPGLMEQCPKDCISGKVFENEEEERLYSVLMR